LTASATAPAAAPRGEADRDGADAGFDCQSCGACCRTELWAITVQPADPTPRYLTRAMPRGGGYAGFDGEDRVRCMRDRDGRCEALHGEIGQAVHCLCYHQRPELCRSFSAGSDDCLMAREMLGRPA
jgi:Fe-S-cluster containining protein